MSTSRLDVAFQFDAEQILQGLLRLIEALRDVEHHWPEDPARSQMHAAYARRRRTRRGRRR